MVMRWLLESTLRAQRWPSIRGTAAGEGGYGLFSCQTLMRVWKRTKEWRSGECTNPIPPLNSPVNSGGSNLLPLSPPTQPLLLLAIQPLCKLSFWLGVHGGGWILHLSFGRDVVITLCGESTLTCSLNLISLKIGALFFFFLSFLIFS